MLQLDTREFTKALMEYQEATKKDSAYILNRAARNVAFRAASNTPKADPSAIESELLKDKLALKIVTKALRAKIGTSYTTAKGKVRTVTGVSRRQIAIAAKRLIANRKKRRGFMRAGWFPAIKLFGGTIRGERPLSGSKADLGGATLANPGRPIAKLYNAVYGRMTGKAGGQSRARMEQALRQAMTFVANDMRQYAREKMINTARKYSGRRT